LWQMIQRLKINCDGRQSDSGCCNWTGEIGNFWEHLQSGTCGMDFCGTKEEPIIESEAASQESNDHNDPTAKRIDPQSPSTPSTCSLCSPDPASAEDWSLDVGSVKSEEELDCADSSTPISEVPVHNLTSLIQSLVELESTDHENTRALQSIHCPQEIPSSLVDCEPVVHVAEYSNDCPLVTPTMECSVKQPQKHDHHSCSSDATAKMSKKQKSKAKAGTAKVARQGETAGYSMSQAAAVHYWQAYQWQAAQYQMAYARHYQMAAHAAQMQQAFQR